MAGIPLVTRTLTLTSRGKLIGGRFELPQFFRDYFDQAHLTPRQHQHLHHQPESDNPDHATAAEPLKVLR
jgi:hypothetical protein